MINHKLVGSLVEVAGETVGIVVSADTKTLLIRKGSVYCLDGETDTFVAGSNAVFIDKSVVEDCYWIKLKPATLITKSININDGRQLVSKFLNVDVGAVKTANELDTMY